MALSPQFSKGQRQEDLLLGIVGCISIGLQVQWGTPSQEWNVIKMPHFLLWPTHLAQGYTPAETCTCVPLNTPTCTYFFKGHVPREVMNFLISSDLNLLLH